MRPFLLLIVIALATVTYAGNNFPLNVTEIILDYGYPVEQHYAQTSDGWLLSLQRIPHGVNGAPATKGVVFLQHGLTDCSVGFNLNNPYESLPFILADNGYDVWLGNNRGNGYSMTNIYWTQKQDQFWNFSFDQMGQIDMPTQIEYVLTYTGEQKLSYVGHSEGTIQAFSGLSYNPALADKMNLYVALAPIAYVGHVESLLLQAMALLDAQDIYEILGIQEFYLPTAISKFLPGICGTVPIICDFTLYALVGPTTYMNNSRLPYYSTYEPNPTSVKNMVHWSQAVKSDTFEMYDYGKKGNEAEYGSATPPQYNLKMFPSTSLPTALFAGGVDALGDPDDVNALIQDIPPSPTTFIHMEATYGHLDPLLGYNAWQRIYPTILDLIAHYQPTSSKKN
eukprot:TRINITY_DN16098_c0_g1_i1.p1 TRINITY_DN16098_c0_g1~~TRINITY_DN16098_c0_g1_i1.p1  ORF type:complete len:395 (-),score=43.16 TRINITY_DN16098_c0_g1_i1:70-1254(-)